MRWAAAVCAGLGVAAVVGVAWAQEARPPAAEARPIQSGPIQSRPIEITPEVNEVERIQTLSKTLGHPALVSETFARTLRRKWIAMGTHRLRGVNKPVSVFAPPATKGPPTLKGKV